jgi:hypothetical protein
MAIDCTCNNTLANLGTPDCPSVGQVAKKFIFVPRFAADGSVNKILKTDITNANLQLKINAANPKDRYYPTAEFENVEDVREDPITQEFNSGKIITVRDGVRRNVGMVPLGTFQELGAYKSYGCAEFGAFVMDAGGNFMFYEDASDPDYAYPILIDNETYHARLVKATDAEVQMLEIAWQWKQSQKDQNLRLIQSDGLDFDADDLEGLFDADAVYSAESLTGFTATITTTLYGTAVEGLIAGDFSLEEISPTPAAIPIVSATETSAGVYDITYAAQTSGDVLRLSATKDGFDFADMSDGTNDITLP